MTGRIVCAVCALFLTGAGLAGDSETPATATAPQDRAPAIVARQRGDRPQPQPQPRPHGRRIRVNPAIVAVDDGDTVTLKWPGEQPETVRILGIDTPETRHPEHDIPYNQPFGLEARAFGQGAFATATDVELLRASTLDPYGRTLGYLFLNGRNYSTLVVRARLAEESVSRYGDNGFPAEAAAVAAAARAAGPLPFEPPGVFRSRMRAVTKRMREDGQDPGQVP